jgi:hypothetical protein
MSPSSIGQNATDGLAQLSRSLLGNSQNGKSQIPRVCSNPRIINPILACQWPITDQIQIDLPQHRMQRPSPADNLTAAPPTISSPLVSDRLYIHKKIKLFDPNAPNATTPSATLRNTSYGSGPPRRSGIGGCQPPQGLPPPAAWLALAVVALVGASLKGYEGPRGARRASIGELAGRLGMLVGWIMLLGLPKVSLMHVADEGF